MFRSIQATRVSSLRDLRDSLEDIAYPTKGFSKLLEPIRRATSRSSIDKRRSVQMPLSPITSGETTPTSILSPKDSGEKEDDITPRRRAQSFKHSSSNNVHRFGSMKLSRPSKESADDTTDAESSTDESVSKGKSSDSLPSAVSAASLLGPKAIASPSAAMDASETSSTTTTTTASTTTPASAIPPALEKKRTLTKKKSRRSKTASLSAALPSHSAGPSSSPSVVVPSSSSTSSSSSESKSVDDVFSKIFQDLKVAQAELKSREEHVRLQEGRLMKKKKALEKREKQLLTKLEQLRENLDNRERLLDQRELNYELRMQKLTRIQNEQRMKDCLNEFSQNPEQVIPLQRKLRVWMCRKALRNAAKVALSAESFKDARRRNAAWKEIHSSEKEHVSRMEFMVKYRNALLEQSKSPQNQALYKKMFIGLDEAVAASKVLLKELNVAKELFPKSTKISNVLIEWSKTYMTAYKMFVNNYDTANAALLEARTKKSFSEFEEKMLSQNIPALDSLLICPIQRLPRYRLLVESLLSFTPDFHVDFAGLKEALEVVRSCIEAVNQGKALAEQMQYLLYLDEHMINQDSNYPLVVSGRHLVHKGLLGDVMEPKSPMKQYFLFNDAIFECILRKKGLKSKQEG